MNPNEFIQNTIDIIEGQLFDKIDINEISKYAYFSKYHYQRLFHSIVGNSVMEYIRKRRLSIAGKEICETDTSILEIALKHGYNTHESFTRAFKAYHGITPTECRKYSIYHSFDKFYFRRMNAHMAKTIINPIGEIFSKNVMNELSKNTDAIMNMLLEFINKAKATAELTMSKSENALGTYNVTFRVISKELLELASRTETVLNNVKEMNKSSANDFYGEELLIAQNNTLNILKAIDDITFQANLISFNAGLQVARTSKEYDISGIMDSFHGLVESISSKKKKINSLILNLVQLVSVDINTQVNVKINNVLNFVKDLYEKAYAVSEYMLSEANASGNPALSFVIIAEEAKHVANDLKRIYSNICGILEKIKLDDNLKQALLQIRNEVSKTSDLAYRINILAFSSQLDAARIPMFKGIESATNQLFMLPVSIHNVREDCMLDLDECESLINLFSFQEQKADLSKALEDIVFQGNLLSFYLKTEAAKLVNIENSEQIFYKNVHQIFNAISDKVIEVVSNIRKTADSLNAQDSNKIFKEMEIHCNTLKALAHEIYQEAIIMDSRGTALIYLSNELKQYAEHINNFVNS